ncbi:hypothetical protein TNCV_4004381 [Trichonephila clavipes]|nr:hypothetical protein TNCV_4004381 [Trichonephila clavipes]
MYFHAFFLLTQNENHLTRKDFSSGNEQIAQNTSRIGLPIVLLEELIAVNDDNVCTAPIMADKGILEFVQSSKNIIDSDSDDENEMNKAALVPTSSEMWNVKKSMRSYLDANSNGEMNNKMDDIDQYVENF